MRNAANSYTESRKLNQFLTYFRKAPTNSNLPVTFGEELHRLRACILVEQAKTQEISRPALKNYALKREIRLSFALRDPCESPFGFCYGENSGDLARAEPRLRISSHCQSS